MDKFKPFINFIRFALGNAKPICGPTKAALELTYRCNSKCKYCKRWKVGDSRNELSTHEWIKLLDELKELNTSIISLGGGEPFLRKDIFDIIKHAKELGMVVGVDTNGLLVEDMIEKIINSGLDTIYFSIESPNPRIHDYIRGIPGGFKKTMSAVSKLMKLKKKPRIYFNLTITNKNISEILNTAKLVKRLGIGGLTINILHSIEEADVPADKELLIPKNRIPELQKQIDLVFKKYSDILCNPKFYCDEFKNFIEDPKKLKKYKCCTCVHFTYISKEGNVFLCGSKYKSVGSIKNNSFKKVWFSKKAEEERKKILKKGCPYKVCWWPCIGPYKMALYMVRRPWLWYKLINKNALKHLAKKYF